MGANEKWKELKQEIASKDIPDKETPQSEPFNWPQYLRGLGIIILFIGCILTLILAVTIIDAKVPGYEYATEFSFSGLMITISTLIVSIILHAVFCWLAEMLRVVKSIRKKLG